MEPELNNYFAVLDRVARAVAVLPRRAATEAVNFSKERFRAQNWVDNGTEPWKKRKPLNNESRKRSGRAILVDTARLKRSIRVVYVGTDSAIIGTDVPYARAHNEGFRGTVRQSVRGHVRKGKRVKPFNRTIKQNIPRRRFIGQSAILSTRLQRMGSAELTKAIKGY